ncbi:MAG: hypothetical protein C4K58_00285 [Flavobacteriaceae bacterium]|nr:MAG: hypothetical protein C4K58_00285 [Flavobacteriaceae bacterium]
MGCTSCSTGSKPGGCKSNGDCSSDRCGKLDVFDWLSNFEQPKNGKAQIVEVRFKNERKEYFINSNHLSLRIGDKVVVSAKSGYDLGMITLTGELVRIQMEKKKIKEDACLEVLRKADEKDLEIWNKAIEREKELLIDARRLSRSLLLEMKISDIEMQGDNSKATFYYTAETRIDFRQLIRDFATKFKTRIEMRQIGYRQETAKIGGIGSCGRELCCSSWLTDFRSVSTSAARYQQLSINPQKLAGQCGKLKCCLNFELDSYLDAIKKMPSANTSLQTEDGKAQCVKIDVFKKEMWFATQGNFNWIKFSTDKVREYLELNKKGEKLPSLETLAKQNAEIEIPEYSDILEDNIQRFEVDKQKNSRSKNKNRKKQNPQNLNSVGQNTQPQKPLKNQNEAQGVAGVKTNQTPGTNPNKKRNFKRRKPRPGGNQNPTKS